MKIIISSSSAAVSLVRALSVCVVFMNEQEPRVELCKHYKVQ